MDEMQEIIQDFLNESFELLDGLDNKFVELEKTPEDPNLLNDIFRSAHTIKGAAGFLGFKQLVEVAHATENILNKLRHGEMKVNPEIMDVILDAVDIIKKLLGNIRDNNQKEEDLSDILSRLNDVLEKGSQVIPSNGPVGAAPEEAALHQSPTPAAPVVSVVAEQVQPTVEQIKPVKEVSESKTQAPEAALQPQQQELRPALDQTIRVDTKRLDDVLNLVGELVLGRNRLIKLCSMLERADLELAESFNEVSSHLDLITTDLQSAVMKTRMQPVGKVFGKFPRMVRDLSRTCGKEVELRLSGEDTEVDKSVVEEIGDPLVHLIRNSIDHGIESPDWREANGKPRKGTVSLSAYQEGDSIIIEINDDGKGIDVAVIKAKAIEKGLLTQSDADKMEEKEILGLIFLPGFSTATEVTNVSGRGVGMDVVRVNISKLNGTIEIDSKVGVGTTFFIKLPLTMAIIQTLMVGVGNDAFAIPITNIVEAIKVTQSELHCIEGREVINLRDSVLPIIRLSERFNITPMGDERGYIVVITVNDRKYGVFVDRLIGEEEVVIKPIDESARSTEEIAGATITGDGKVVLILDVSKMINSLLEGRMGRRGK